MLVLVGLGVVGVCLILGYTLHGGHLAVLFQPTELLIIGGVGIGSLIISSPVPLLRAIVKQVMKSITGKEISKADYLELLMLLFEIFKTAKGNMLGLEAHVENPENSEIFKKYPNVLKNTHAVHFICDTLKVQISSPVSPFDLEELMDTDLKAAHEEEHAIPTTLARLGDAMPGLGIVAAVLGVVITMGKLAEGREAIGHSVAAALVGTFTGVLACYGFLQPLSAKIELQLGDEGIFMSVIKAGVLAFAKDTSPKVCVEFARRMIPPQVRPTFEEVDKATANIKKA